MKSTVAACVATLLALCAAGAGPASGTVYMALYSDEGRSSTNASGTPIYSAEVYVFCLPESYRGLKAAELRLIYPSNVISSTTTWNGDISVRLGSLPAGVSVSFQTCHGGWTWIAHQTIYVTNSEYSLVKLAPRPDLGVLQIASCETGYPIYPASVLSNFALNCGAAFNSLAPRLAKVDVIVSDSAPDRIHATFTTRMPFEAYWFPQPHRFQVSSDESPPETLEVLSAQFVPDSDQRTIELVLGQELIPGGYLLKASNICNDDYVEGCCWGLATCLKCADSELGFTYAPVATLLRDFSVEPLSEAVRVSWELGAIDEGISFLPMRLEKGALEFEALPVEVMEEHGLRYRFVDGSARPGEAFRYRVDYIRGGDRHTLFETDWVEPLPAKFVLRQNLPNPFNPSTRISFELGESCRAALAVYDVRGKLVRVLARGPMEAGAHSAVWDGRNERGDPVASGVYFYRLRAGSFTETKKLVLLR